MPRVLFIAPIYNYEPILLHSLRLQSHSDWQLILIHDGPNETGLADYVRHFEDSRIRYYETEQRFDDWGHSLRALALEQIRTEPIAGDFIVVTNADNYYCPAFVDQMLNAFQETTIATYCWMSHSHHKWKVLEPQLRHARIDCGCLMVRRDAMLSVGWASREHAADWACVAALVARFGAESFVKVDHLLFVHN